MNYVPSFFFLFSKYAMSFVVVFRDRDRLSDRQTEKDTPLLLTTHYVTKLKML